MAIDIHAHFYPPKFMQYADKLASGSGAASQTARYLVNNPRITRDPLFQGELETRIAMMDEAGMDWSIGAPFEDTIVLMRLIFIGAERLVFGTDFPFVNRQHLGAGIQMLAQANFDERQTQYVLRNTIASRLA